MWVSGEDDRAKYGVALLESTYAASRNRLRWLLKVLTIAHAASILGYKGKYLTIHSQVS